MSGELPDEVQDMGRKAFRVFSGSEDPSVLNSLDPTALPISLSTDPMLTSVDPSGANEQHSGTQEFAHTATPLEMRYALEEVLGSHRDAVEVHELLGAGTFSYVFRCTVRDEEGPVAVKVIIPRSACRAPLREASILGALCHPNLVQLKEAIEGPPACLVLELCSGGSLQTWLHHEPGRSVYARLSTQERGRALLDVASALQHLHSHAVLHRDIKPGNCFLTAPMLPEAPEMPLVKVGDFGFARTVDTSSSQMTKRTGTLRYMAPEVLDSDDYTTTADIFSFAILGHEVITGQLPYGGGNSKSDISIFVAVVQGMRPPLEHLPHCGAGAALRYVLEACWRADPKQRLDAGKLMEHLCQIFA